MTIRAMNTATTGMTAMMNKIDTISNNLSNVNTWGFKKTRVNFQDLMYQHLKDAGFTSSASSARQPSGIEIGLGVKLVSTQKMFSQGSLVQTDNQFDMAILGDGFFKVILPDGTTGYTRDGSFRVDGTGAMVNNSGLYLEPRLTIPENVTKISVSVDGIVEGEIPGEQTPVSLGEVTITRFINSGGMKSLGDNLYVPTEAAGQPLEGQPGIEGRGVINQYMLEASNVNVVEELVDMISTQRAYEINANSIQTADSMMQTINNLKR